MRLRAMPLFLLLAVAADASARPPPPKPVEPPPPALAPDTVQKLKSGDPAQIRAALDDARMAAKGAAPAVPAIVELLHKGTSLALTQAAIATLADIESPEASDVLAIYARHRSVLVRDAAVKALASTKGEAAVQALRAALSDPELAVRQDALAGLVALKAREAMPELFLAMERRMPKAAQAIGTLCGGAECEHLADETGKLPFDTVGAGAWLVMFRPQHEVGDEVKLRIVEKMAGSGIAEAKAWLAEVKKGWPAAGSRRVKEALERATQGAAP